MKEYCNGNHLHQKILEGVNILADNVASTLGPRGRNVILQNKGRNPITTKDGVTVAKFIELKDPMRNAGAQILKQASEQTNNEAGDGTTTSTVLARAILQQAQKYITAGVSPIEIKRGIDKTVDAMVKKLAKLSKPSWYENKWLYFGYGVAAVTIPTYFGIKIVNDAFYNQKEQKHQ